MLTDAGKTLVAEGRALLDDAEQLAKRVQAAGELVEGELSIAVPHLPHLP